MAGDGAAGLADEIKSMCQMVAATSSRDENIVLPRREIQEIVDDLRIIEGECGTLSSGTKLLIVRRMCSELRSRVKRHL